MRKRLGLGVLPLVLLMFASAAPAAAGQITLWATTKSSATSRYEVLPAKGLIKVNVTLKVTNQTPDSVETYACDESYWDYYLGWITFPKTCETRTRHYVTTTRLIVEGEASQIKATSTAGSVKLTKDPASTSSLRIYEVTYPRIFKGQTRTINVSYVIRSGAPRSASTVRINGAYLNFRAISQVTDQASVTIVVPKSFSTYSFGGKVKEVVKGSKRTYSSGWVADPASYYVGIYGHDLDGFAESAVASDDGRMVLIQGWPGDREWMDTVKKEAASSISALEALIGQPMPGTGVIAIREVAPDVLGDAYGGRFFSDTQVALVPEDPGDPGTVAHELSHAWFNEGLFASTWMAEGYAGWAERAVGANTEPCTGATVGLGDTPNLSDWKVSDPRSTDSMRLAVAAQYGAACEVVTDIADQIGTERMRDVLAVLSTSNAAYPGTQDTVPGAAVDWRQWLDAVDELGMAPAGVDATEATAATLIKYGIANEADLVGRRDARKALVELRGEAGSIWTIPPAVYRPLATWDFANSTKAMASTTAIIDGVQAVAGELPDVPVSSSPFRARLAAATTLADLVEVEQTAAAQVAAATAVAAAIDRVNAEHGPLVGIGLVGVDLSPQMTLAVSDVASLEFDGALGQVAAIDSALQGATTTGLVRLGAVLGLLALAIGVGYWLKRRRDSDPIEAESLPAFEASFDGSGTVVGQIPMAGQPAASEATDAA